MNFAVGSLVKARGREWVVLPDSDQNFLKLRPLRGSEEETAGVYLPLEPVAPASFELPPATPENMGDHRSCRLLRDAVRLGFRASSGPFRCFGHIAVEPRPYQLVPLLMAMKLEPVRLLIADDVGIGKTIEAGLVARELLDRGEVQRLAVLCPPQLAEQWQKELREKFQIEAKLVLPSTVKKLEQGLGSSTSLFDVHPHVIVSLDYIKADRRRDYFKNNCPELVIVDEAHTCASTLGGRAKQQRFELVKSLSEDPSRHMLFVTATPHSGKNDVFHTLLSFLKPDFAQLPDDLSGPENERFRRQLSNYFVQRRRGDIKAYMDTKTSFPEREVQEITWTLSDVYRSLFERVLDFARETVHQGQDKSAFQQRIRWWSALALLRSMASSPAAAAATLRNRADALNAETEEEADAIGQQRVMDLMDEEGGESLDVIPGGDPTEAYEQAVSKRDRKKLQDMARTAEQLMGEGDTKLKTMVGFIKKLLKEGFSPIVFCRFIPTAEYVAEQLRKSLKGVEVIPVTGLLPSSEREFRVRELGQYEKRVLVCTDCLSEGINLQEHFDAAVHYDLSWNPTRHEQREGRVDRFGQQKEQVRFVTYYGTDNQIDGIVLDVLLRKHKSIRKALGVTVPIPEDSSKVMQAILEGLLLRGKKGTREQQQLLPGVEDFYRPQKEELDRAWDEVAKREEKRSRTIFAQQSIKVEEVARELEAANEAAGSAREVESFVTDALKLMDAGVNRIDRPNGSHVWNIDLQNLPYTVKDKFPEIWDQFKAVFDHPVPEKTKYLSRTHQFVEALATHVLDTSLDPVGKEKVVARRCGAVYTDAVQLRTTLLLLRLRFNLQTRGADIDRHLLSEECQLLAFAGAPEKARWLDQDQARALLKAEPRGNITPDRAGGFVQKVGDGFQAIKPTLDDLAKTRADELLDAHRRVRTASKNKGLQYKVIPQGTPDILGIYVFLPHMQ